MDAFSCLNVTVDDHVAHVQLNRPNKANALDKTLWLEIKSAFDWVDREPAVRVAILSGAGKHFSAGIDFDLVRSIFVEIGQLKPGLKEERLRSLIVQLQAAFSALETCCKPVLSAVHGRCIGAGLDLITACDMRYASAEARFSLKEVDLGIVADVGSLQRLPYLIGAGRVRELAFTGRDVTAAEAEQVGLVNRVFADPAQLLEGVRAIAAAIATKSPLTVRGIKRVLNYSRDHSVASGLDFVATWNSAMLLSAESQEAMLAVMQKRSPQFGD